jgi:hypothetical protein
MLHLMGWVKPGGWQMEFGDQGIKEAEFMGSSPLQEKASGGFAENNFEAPTVPEGDLCKRGRQTNPSF